MSTTEPTLSIRARSALAGVRVAVLMGGSSGEREVSLISGQSVSAALERSQRANALGEVRAIEIDRDGRWIMAGAAEPAARAIASCGDIDVFFLAMHGGAGEDGTLQGLLAACGRLHTGSGVAASAICMDKAATRGLAQANGLRVAAGRVISKQAFAQDRAFGLERARALAQAASGWVVKPRRGGSSVNTHLVLDASQLEASIASVLASGDDALLEERIAGVEVSCGVLEQPAGFARALPCIEIQPDKGRFFDYEQKYSAAGATELCPATSLTPAQEERLRESALLLHSLCGCAGYSRSDFIVPQHGDPVLLEINTLPGLTPRSLLPQEAAASGVSYDELCLSIVEAALAGGRA